MEFDEDVWHRSARAKVSHSICCIPYRHAEDVLAPERVNRVLTQCGDKYGESSARSSFRLPCLRVETFESLYYLFLRTFVRNVSANITMVKGVRSKLFSFFIRPCNPSTFQHKICSGCSHWEGCSPSLLANFRLGDSVPVLSSEKPNFL